MKRKIAHIVTVFFTSCVLIYNLCCVEQTEYFLWYVLNISANMITIFLLVKNLNNSPKSINDSLGMFLIAVLSTNLPVFISLIGSFGKYSDVLILKQIATVINLLTMPWYLYSVLSLGNGFTVLPESNDLKATKAYRYSRHPLYITYIVWIVTQNMIFQSIAILIISVVQIVLFVIRAKNEEKILTESFPQYKEYKSKVYWLGRKR